jgi:hypothetical protein
VSGGSATFSGTGASRSTITWTAATHTLTIALGAATGTFATVASSKPIYTASPTITDSSGLSVSNSPFTLATANQF